MNFTKKTFQAKQFRGALTLLILFTLTLSHRASGYATYAGEVLEHWSFDDPSGTPMSSATNLAGFASWSVTAEFTDGAGNLNFIKGGDHWSSSAKLPKILPPGEYEIKWGISAMDLRGTSVGDNCGASLSFDGFPDIRVFAYGTNHIALSTTGGPNGWDLIRSFDRSLSNLTIRVVFNTVDHTAVLYSTLGTEAEQSKAFSPINDVQTQALKGSFLAGSMSSSDYTKIDYISLTALHVDTDGDGIFNNVDTDDDNDGHLDDSDKYPFDPSEWADDDQNGVGDNVQFDPEILNLFSNKFGVVLSSSEHDTLARAVKPFLKEQWRIDAEERIEQTRKSNLKFTIVDAKGNPLPQAEVRVKLRKKKFLFSCAISSEHLVGTNVYSGITQERLRELILEFCDGIGAYNAFKSQFRWQFFRWLDDFVAWGEENEMPVRAHLLMWPSYPHNVPASGSAYGDEPNYPIRDRWEDATNNPTPANIEILRDTVDFQISDWASRWKVYEWDVVNEASDGNIFTNLLGDHCTVDWFNNAATNVVVPGARLLLNDFFLITGNYNNPYIQAKVGRFKQLVEHLQTNNAPIDAIGFQAHFGSERILPDELYQRMNEYAAYGLKLAGTEYTLPSTVSEDKLVNWMAEIMTIFFSHPSAYELVSWGLFGNKKSSMIDTNTGKPNLVGLAWYYLQRVAWNTDTNLTADASGSVTLRTFKGDYDIIITYEGQDYLVFQSLDAGLTNRIVLPDANLADVEQYWSFDDAKHTGLNSAINQKGSASWNISDPETDGHGNLVVDSTTTNSSTAMATLPSTLSSGKYELKWNVELFDLSHSNVSTNCGVTLSPESLFPVRLSASGSNQLALSVFTPLEQQMVALPRTVSNLTVRAIYDLGLNTVDIYFQNDDQDEQLLGHYAGGSPTDVNNLSAKFLGEGMGKEDLLKINYILWRRLSPQTLYQDWMNVYSTLSSATNQLDDPDGDGACNLQEYALGGNPEDPSNSGTKVAPSIENAENEIRFKLIFARRKDYAARGLSYQMEKSTNLMVSTSWVDAGETEAGASEINSEFDAVTNLIPIPKSLKREFFRLNIQTTTL